MHDHDKQAAEQSVAALTAEIASAYVSNNTIAPGDIGRLIADIGRLLRSLGEPPEPNQEKPEPVVSVRRSIGGDHLICLVCGRKQRTLKRHLASEHQLTPDEYRRLFDLRADYPMVAPNYAEMRRALALKIGFGRPKKTAKKKDVVSKKTGAPKVKAAAQETETPARTRRTKAEAS